MYRIETKVTSGGATLEHEPEYLVPHRAAETITPILPHSNTPSLPSGKGTDVKPLECLLFMRNINSASYFEQMKGRGASFCAGISPALC